MSPTDVPACPHAAAAARRRVADLARTIAPHPTAAEVAGVGEVYVYQEDLKKCRADLRAFIDEVNCHPILLRLAWHDAGTFDNTIGTWPQCGGANGSIRFDPEMDHGANAGLKKAIGYLKQFNEKYPNLSWADLIQLAGATAIECAGGPKMYMRYGRVDTATPTQCPKEGNLPDAEAPYHDGADPDAATHLRRVFYRMGFGDREIVALSGAHALGRCHADASGYVGPWSGTPLLFNNSYFVLLKGLEWTPDDTKAKFQYRDPSGNLMMLPSDIALIEDPKFKKFVLEYAKDQKVFFEDFAAAFEKLETLGTSGLTPLKTA